MVFGCVLLLSSSFTFTFSGVQMLKCLKVKKFVGVNTLNLYFKVSNISVSVYTSCPVSVFSRAAVQWSWRVGRVGRVSDRVRVDRRRGPKQIRPVCFRQRTNVLQHHIT